MFTNRNRPVMQRLVQRGFEVGRKLLEVVAGLLPGGEELGLVTCRDLEDVDQGDAHGRGGPFLPEDYALAADVGSYLQHAA